MTQVSIKQSDESSALKVACEIIGSATSTITNLNPGSWVIIDLTCPPGIHVLRIGTMLATGTQMVTLELKGATFNGESEIVDEFDSGTGGMTYDIEVAQ